MEPAFVDVSILRIYNNNEVNIVRLIRAAGGRSPRSFIFRKTLNKLLLLRFGINCRFAPAAAVGAFSNNEGD